MQLFVVSVGNPMLSKLFVPSARRMLGQVLSFVSSVAITLKIYTQVRSEEIEASLPNRPSAREIKDNLNIVPFRLRMV